MPQLLHKDLILNPLQLSHLMIVLLLGEIITGVIGRTLEMVGAGTVGNGGLED